MLIANVPINEWLQPDFLSEDGKIFMAYLPIFIVPLLFYKLNLKPRWGIMVFFVVTIILALLAIIQYYLEFRIPGFDARQQLVLFGGEVGRSLLAGLRQQNATAAFLLFPTLFAVVQTFITKRIWIWGTAALTLLTAIVLTISRSGAVGLSVGISILLVMAILKSRTIHHRWHKLVFLAVALVVTNFVLYLAVISVPSFKAKIVQVESLPGQTSKQSLQPGEESPSPPTLNKESSPPAALTDPEPTPVIAGNLSSRLYLWQKAINDVATAPIFGVGITRYNDRHYTTESLIPGITRSTGGEIINNDAHAHNSFLHIWAEAGTLGLGLFLAFWLLVLWKIYGRIRRRESKQGMAFHLAVLGSVMGLMASSLFEHNMAAPSVMFTYSFLLGFYALPGDRAMGFNSNFSTHNTEGRILWLNHRAALGGGEKILLTYLLSSKIDKDKFRVVTFENGALVDTLREHGYRVKVLEADNRFVSIDRNRAGFSSWLAQGRVLVGLIWQLISYIKSEDISLVIGNSSKADMVGVFSARISGRPMAVRLHDTVRIGEFNRKTYYLLKLLFVAGVDYFMSVSKVVDDSLATMGVPQERRQVIYNGIEPPKLASSTSLKSRTLPGGKGGLRVAVFSRLIRHKGQHVVVKLWPKVLMMHPEAKLYLVGGALFDTEGYDEYLRDLVSQLGLNKSVIFTGFIDNVSSALRETDVLVQPSLNPDPLPTSIIEAVWHGVYVIASDSGGAKEILTNSKLGSLYAWKDSNELLRLIIQALKSHPSTHRLPSPRSNFAQTFSIQAYVLNMDEAVLQLERIL